MFCKVGAPGYVSNAMFGVVVNVATICGILTIDKVRSFYIIMAHMQTCGDMQVQLV